MVASVIDRALLPDPADRHPSMVAMLRLVDRAAGPRMYMLAGRDERAASAPTESAEARIRWATGDDYEILAPLGRGTFGLVWRARDLSLEREVAMKMLHPHISKDDAAIGRFQREARLAAQLAHPSIVPIYEWDNRGDVSWYTMELAENGSVADLVAREGARPFSEVAPQIDSVLDGLAAAHAVGIIHRDLKPENILIDRYRRWRISDFGIAHAFGEDVGGSSGTPAFAPPEQLLGEPQGPAADVFALAAIVYFVLTSEPPFGEHSGKIILSRQLSGKRALQGFQPELASWLERGLATSPEERFSDANEMRAEWIKVVEIVRRRERKSDWWRRLFGMRDTNDRGNGPRGTLNADAAARWSLDRQVD
jgi:serine/threonine-protein kinase